MQYNFRAPQSMYTTSNLHPYNLLGIKHRKISYGADLIQSYPGAIESTDSYPGAPLITPETARKSPNSNKIAQISRYFPQSARPAQSHP